MSQKTVTLTGKFTTFTKVYNKVKVYFGATGDFSGIISDLYALCRVVGEMSMNKSSPMRCEIPEMTIKGSSVTITFEVEVDETGLRTIAESAFGRNVVLDISYGEENAQERVSNRFYAKMSNTMDRLASALGMTSIMELKAAIDNMYGYSVPINSNMYQVDAEQLYAHLANLAETIPGFILDQSDMNDAYLQRRLAERKCGLCNGAMESVMDGVPLCKIHRDERKKTTGKKFKEKYKL